MSPVVCLGFSPDLLETQVCGNFISIHASLVPAVVGIEQGESEVTLQSLFQK